MTTLPEADEARRLQNAHVAALEAAAQAGKASDADAVRPSCKHGI